MGLVGRYYIYGPKGMVFEPFVTGFDMIVHPCLDLDLVLY